MSTADRSSRKKVPNFGKNLRREKQRLLIAVGKRSEVQLPSDPAADAAREQVARLVAGHTGTFDAVTADVAAQRGAAETLAKLYSAMGLDGTQVTLAHDTLARGMAAVQQDISERLQRLGAVKKLVEHRDKIRLDVLAAKHDVDSLSGKAEAGDTSATSKLPAAEGKFASMHDRLEALTAQVTESITPLVETEQSHAAQLCKAIAQHHRAFALAWAELCAEAQAGAEADAAAAPVPAVATTTTVGGSAGNPFLSSSADAGDDADGSESEIETAEAVLTPAAVPPPTPAKSPKKAAVAAIARFDSACTSERELEFKRGDRLRVYLDSAAKGWQRAERESDGKRGWVGEKYVRLLDSPEANMVPYTVRRYRRALYAHDAQGPDELSFLEDDVIEVMDDGGAQRDSVQWWRGRMFSGLTGNFDEGLFPASYTEAIAEDSQLLVHALHHFIPREPTELQLMQSQRYVILTEEDGWCRGTPEVGDGRVAEFPRKYVEPVGKTESATQKGLDGNAAGAELPVQDEPVPEVEVDATVRDSSSASEDAEHAEGILGHAVAQFDFEGGDDADLPFVEGDRLVITGKKPGEDDWLQGYLEDDVERKVGDIPVNYIEMV